MNKSKKELAFELLYYPHRNMHIFNITIPVTFNNLIHSEFTPEIYIQNNDFVLSSTDNLFILSNPGQEIIDAYNNNKIIYFRFLNAVNEPLHIIALNYLHVVSQTIH